jgi:hypothetical protein
MEDGPTARAPDSSVSRMEADIERILEGPKKTAAYGTPIERPKQRRFGIGAKPFE